MLYPPADWANKRKEGIGRFLAVDGVLKLGAPFAFVMKINGMLVFRAEGQTFGQYISASMTWVTFFLNATAFGLVMGFINWRRNEKAYFESGLAKKTDEG